MSHVLDSLRAAELAEVYRCFRPGARILELGGGNGFQAALLAAHGFQVESIDVAGRPPGQQHFPVRDYDGKHIPFEHGVFDHVFSSNVLEHIRDLDITLDEMKRVTKADATFVHLLPSSTWRFWTNLTHYPYLVRRFVFRVIPPDSEVSMPSSMSDSIARRGFAHTIRRSLLPAPHGEYPNALAELYYFSALRWSRLFRGHGFEIIEQSSGGLFYTGYAIAPSLSIATRRRLASLLGSACNLFVLRRQRPQS